MNDLLKRLETFNEKVERISDKSCAGALSPEGTSNALALLLALNAQLFLDCADALRRSA